MKEAILLSHVYIENNELYKLNIIDLCLKYYRRNNPNSFILLTGHGKLPYDSSLEFCDEYFWHDEIINSEINMGHPKLVNIGLDILISKGFDKVCKCRADSIHLINNIVKYCDEIISNEKSKLLITTTNNYKYYMGDLFIYGEILFLKKCWAIDTWYPTKSGLTSLGKNFLRAVNANPFEEWNKDALLYEYNTWHDLLVKYTSYRDPETLRWIDFRKHWRSIFSIEDHEELLLNNKFNYLNYIWKDWPTSEKTKPYNEDLFYGLRNGN